MKKRTALLLALACMLGMAGCQNTVSASDVYAFPEQTAQITVSRCSQGTERSFVIELDEYDFDDFPINTYYGVVLWTEIKGM